MASDFVESVNTHVALTYILVNDVDIGAVVEDWTMPEWTGRFWMIGFLEQRNIRGYNVTLGIVGPGPIKKVPRK